MARTGSRGAGKSSGGTSSSGSSSGSGSGSSSGSSSSGSSSSGGSSGGSSGSGGASSGGSGSSSGGSGGTGGTKSGQSGAHAHKTAGSSSTTTPANTQSVAVVSSPDYSAALGYSTNSLTQGAGSASNVSASNVQQSQNTTGQANLTTLGTLPAANTLNASYQGSVGQQQYVMMVEKYGKETADRLATQTYTHYDLTDPAPATNTDNQYLQSENAALTNAEKRQQEFVNNNTFMANPQQRATAPIPNVITVSTPLYRQAGEKENPLAILEGNKFISPSQQYLPQVNEQFAPKPEYTAFTNNPYIGVHQNSDISPNADLSESQRKSPIDYLIDIKNHKYFPLAIIGIVVLVVLSMFGGARVSRARGGGGKGVFRSVGGSGQPIITVVK